MSAWSSCPTLPWTSSSIGWKTRPSYNLETLLAPSSTCRRWLACDDVVMIAPHSDDVPLAHETRMKNPLRLALLSALLTSSLAQAAELIPIDVYRDANCGCCKKWISQLQRNGFKVNDHVEADMSAVKQRLGVAPRLGSCHTAVIDGKFVEGHVPAEQVLALRKRDDLLGIAAPGMPMGSPGMEMDGKSDAYQVIGLTREGKDVVVADYPAH